MVKPIPCKCFEELFVLLKGLICDLSVLAQVMCWFHKWFINSWSKFCSDIHVCCYHLKNKNQIRKILFTCHIWWLNCRHHWITASITITMITISRHHFCRLPWLHRTLLPLHYPCHSHVKNHIKIACHEHHNVSYHWQLCCLFNRSSSFQQRYHQSSTLFSISMLSCQKGPPTRHVYAWQIGPFWQDTLDFHDIMQWIVNSKSLFI